jgi:hypothetical protein
MRRRITPPKLIAIRFLSEAEFFKKILPCRLKNESLEEMRKAKGA